MENTSDRAIAIVGVGAILPDAPNVSAFWENIKNGRDSISEVRADRWDPALYYDPDPRAPDKSYSKIGGWARDFVWDPVKWHLPIPPRVVDAMDGAQKWAIACTREALEDYGYPKRPLELERTAVILGNAMAGEKHYLTALRIYFPEYARELAEISSFSALPAELQRRITDELHDRIGHHLPEISEDSMPGELANCIAGRIANIFNFHGPNYICDAACASAMAAINSATEGLVQRDFDAVITGGIDRNMGASTFVKFCKIGALSATGTRPYAEGADGFVMGEGAAIFLMKRLADAEGNGDKVYAVLRGMGGSSDGKGKGITAPNPIGQKLAIERAWKNAGLSPATATYIEGHGTSTRVGDVVEVQSMVEVLKDFQLPPHSIGLGSVKSNFGHLKGAAGAAGLLKTALALRDKVIPPSVHCERPNPEIDFAHAPVYVNTALAPWTVPPDGVRRAGLSAFGFGGTNFHAVLEEYIPGRLKGNGKRQVFVSEKPPAAAPTSLSAAGPAAVTMTCKAPLRGALVVGGGSVAALTERLRAIERDAKSGKAPVPSAPAEADLRAPERLAIDYADAAELASKSAMALKALAADQPAVWKALRGQGIFRGQGPAPKVAFLYTGQGSQYVNMLRVLRDAEPIVAETFAEADRVMIPLLGKPLTEFMFVDQTDPAAVAKSEDDLRQTAITQPAVMAIDAALTRLLAAYGIRPDMAMGHSLGEYGALVAAGALPFEDALEAVSARGRGMTKVAVADKGRMAAVLAPMDEIEKILKTISGYVVIANINSDHQAVIGGASDAVGRAIEVFQKAGFDPVELPVSHAFHTSIVAPASEPLRIELQRLHLQSPRLPIVANINGEFYPTGPDVVPQMQEILARQVASPVQFVKGLRTLYDAGARIFVEVGPKKALQGFAEDVLGNRGDVVSLFTNHPKIGDIASFNQALCGLYAAGLGRGTVAQEIEVAAAVSAAVPVAAAKPEVAMAPTPEASVPEMIVHAKPLAADHYEALGHFFADVLEKGWKMYRGDHDAPKDQPVVISGAALGLPGTEHVFDDGNIGRILAGEQFIDVIPTQFRRAMLDKHITRLVKSDNGGPTFETINNVADVIKLAGRGGAFDLEQEFGVPADRLPAFDRVTRLAIGAGIDALRDAGIPLVMRYKTTSKGTQLPDRWVLPEALRDETGVIFASAFPGYDSFAEEMARYYTDRARRDQLAGLENLQSRLAEGNGYAPLRTEIDRRIEELRSLLERETYVFDRRFLFRVLSMGHSQFAEYIGARGPNTAINAACASTTQAVSLAEDWIRGKRCRRVIVVSADDVTSDSMMGWFGAGFLASGAAATDDVVEEAAIPFDRRRHGLIVGMGAAALVVESAEAARERGIQPICEVLGSSTANSAFHGTRLDVQHIGEVMERLMAAAEVRAGISRDQIAPRTVFVSHETYTPARGGSASAEIYALRRVFGNAADQVVIANTKGFTGHAMGAGIEDVLAVKALETGIVPPVANFKEVDPELGVLNLSKGGAYPVEYALRLGAGFGSQISMTLLRWVATKDGVRRSPNALGYAYRIVDDATWKQWLGRMVGRPTAHLEVVRRTLRVRDQGPAARFVGSGAESRSVPTAAPITKPIAAVGVMATAPAVVSAPAHVAAVPAALAAIPAEIKKEEPVEMVRSALAPTPALVASEKAMAPALAAPVVAGGGDGRGSVLSSTTSVPGGDGASPVSTGGESVKERILALVVEKTGYPQDMLDLDLDLEADLGIDTVKQAEMFAAIREIYSIPRDENRRLRDYPTLAHVIRFVHEKRPDLAGAPASRPEMVAASALQTTPGPQTPVAAIGGDGSSGVVSLAPSAPSRDLASGDGASGDGASLDGASPVSTGGESVKERILALVVEKTGYPKDMLDLDLDLEADLGIDTVKQAEMFAAIREIYSIPRDENRKLRDYPTLAHVIRFVYEKRPDLMPAAVPVPVPAALGERAKTGVGATAGDGASPVSTASGTSEPSATAEQSVTLVAVPVAAAPADVTSQGDPIQEKVLEIVAEKTGYPKDMLDLDLDLEADLGIDTVKQAEMFASVRAAFNIPRDADLKLRDFPTLAHVIRFAYERRPGAAPAPTAQPAERKPEASVMAAKPAPRPALASFEAANRIPRRVPVATLRPPLSMCKPTAAVLGSGRRVVVMADKGGVAEALVLRLQSMGVEVLRIEGSPAADALADHLKGWLAAGPVHGVYWLPALDCEGNIRSMDLATWHEALRVRIKSLYATMRVLYEQIGPRGTFLVSATRLGGQHGYDDAGAVAPLGGAVVGFSKTYKRERAEVLVKAVDFEEKAEPAVVAELLVDETQRDPGAVEIGYQRGQRWTIALQEEPAVDGKPGLTLNKETVFLITGAAGSIVSAITADLAAASGGTFYLLDLVPEPDPNNPDLKRFANDKEGLKRELFSRIQQRGERATPALVERELAALERAQAAQSAIDAVRAAGGTAHYFSVNLTDADAVARVIATLRQRSGHLDVLLHAAGIERSHFLPDKDAHEFDLIFDVKSDGWFNLMRAIGEMPLKATVAFSSIAGRFGNAGQTDYSSANDLLCKLTSNLRRTRPDTRGIVIDWTAWGGIGMATRGSIPKMMEVAGIDMLPPEAGVPLIRRELTAGSTRGEIVIGQRLGVLLDEWDVEGGLEATSSGAPEQVAAARGPMLGRIASAGLQTGLLVETALDPTAQPFLRDHQIEGTPVLPGVMGVEGFAEAALCLLPGWHIEAVEDVAFLAPFKFYRNEPRTATVHAMISQRGGVVLADCSLIGRRALANQKEMQETRHFSARVRLIEQATKLETAAKPGAPAGTVVEAADIYRVYFHGPAYQVLERAWWDGKRVVGKMASHLPTNHQPADLPTRMAPRLIELCFQTAGLWEMGAQGRMGLPRSIEKVAVRRAPDPSETTLFALVTPHPDRGCFDAEVVDAAGNCYVRMIGYRTVALPNAIEAESLRKLQAAMLAELVAA